MLITEEVCTVCSVSSPWDLVGFQGGGGGLEVGVGQTFICTCICWESPGCTWCSASEEAPSRRLTLTQSLKPRKIMVIKHCGFNSFTLEQFPLLFCTIRWQTVCVCWPGGGILTGELILLGGSWRTGIGEALRFGRGKSGRTLQIKTGTKKKTMWNKNMSKTVIWTIFYCYCVRGFHALVMKVWSSLTSPFTFCFMFHFTLGV